MNTTKLASTLDSHKEPKVAILSGNSLYVYAIRNLIRRTTPLPVYVLDTDNLATHANVGLRLLVVVADEHELHTCHSLQTLRLVFPQARMLVVLLHCTPQSIASLMQLGVHSIWTAQSSIEDLVDAIEITLDGRSWLDPHLFSMHTRTAPEGRWDTEPLGLRGVGTTPPRPPAPGRPAQRRSPFAEAHTPPSLSNRELQIIELMQAGCSNQEIAKNLFLSINTVKTHVSRIMQRLNAGSRTEAVVKAIRLGLLPSLS